MNKRPNPAVAQSETAARISEEMATLAEKEPLLTNLPRRIASRRRATADKIKKEHPNLIAYGE